MKTNSDKLSSLGAVFASFCAFFTASGILSLVLRDAAIGVLGSLVPYLFGWLCAVGVLKFAARLLPERDAEEESAAFGDEGELHENKYSLKSDIYASVLTLALLLLLNFALSFFADGKSAEFSAAAFVIGAFLKPFCEETYFRYGISVILMRSGKLSRSMAVAVSAVLFALIHKASAMPFALVAGVLLGILATRHTDRKDGFRRGAVCSLAVHAAYNLILYAVLYRRCI